MKVLLIGKTKVDLFPFQGDSRHVMPGKAEGSEFEKRVRVTPQSERENGQNLIEFAGRLCYESFNLPSEKTKTNSGYVQNVIGLGHESVLEHASVTFYIEGVSRSLSHELIRHRHLSFSELSQRYVDMKDAKYIIPPLFRDLDDWPAKIDLPLEYKEKYEYNAAAAVEYGASRKQAREAARAVLPNATETKLVVSGNLRAWRDVLKKRWSAHADAEIQELAGNIFDLLAAEYPDVFADINFQEN